MKSPAPDKPAASPSPVKTPLPVAVKQAVAVVAKEPARFKLDAGFYFLRDRQAKAEKIIRQLGYEPQLKGTKQTVAMTRLKVGSYAPVEAKAKLIEIRKLVPDAFLLPEAGGQAALYAGSYFLLDEGRKSADRLYAQGVRVEEVPAKVAIKGQSITFGGFSDRDAAEQMVLKARAAGLKVGVIAVP